jgi:serine phosphatase RsbU (regulator of sigma subunit)
MYSWLCRLAAKTKRVPFEPIQQRGEIKVFAYFRWVWNSVQWKMLAIVVFLGIISTFLIASFSAAILNVVIRRESTYLVEERIKVIVESRKKLADAVIDHLEDCSTDSAAVKEAREYLDSTWPGSEIEVTSGAGGGGTPEWLDNGEFTGIAEDDNRLEIRFVREVRRPECRASVVLRIPLGKMFLEQLTNAAGLTIANSEPMMLKTYRSEGTLLGEVWANFVPGTRLPAPVVVVAQNWKTGHAESWVVCQIRPSYARTVEDLSRMGLRTASWVWPSAGLAVALVAVCAGGLFLCVQMSRRIVSVINSLSHATRQVGAGDFSVRVPIGEEDQLGELATSFNQMAHDLEDFHARESQRIVLERDMALAREAQQYLYPRSAPVLSGANVWGVTKAARMVSGDLYDFFHFNRFEVGLLCADVSGKGMSAALMMAQLQAVARGKMLSTDEASERPSPESLVTALNKDMEGRFGDAKFVTMFYGEFDSRTGLLRYVNAGHCLPTLISEEREAKALQGGDLPVGLFPEASFQEFQISLTKGSAIVVCSDGVTDALNRDGQEFGNARLLALCSSLPDGADAKIIAELLAERVAEWSAGVDQFDDITILTLSVS